MAVPNNPVSGEQAAPGVEAALVADASSDTPIVLPSNRFATDAQFLRQGDDLLLTGPDGATVIVRDYFLTDPPPDLLTPSGGRLTAALIRSFMPPEALAQIAQLGDGGAEPIGQVSSAVGTVFAVRSSGARVQLGAGDPVFQGDVIETADSGAVNLLFVDKTTFALGGDARLALDELVFNPETREGSSTFSILKGVFVFASGEIAKVNPLDMTVQTTVATIGIRGTKVAGEVNPAGEISKFTILKGKIVVTTDEGSVELSELNETTIVTGFDAPPSRPVILSDAEIDRNYGAVKDVSGNFFAPGGKTGGGEDDPDRSDDSASDLAPASGGEGAAEGDGGELASSSGDEFDTAAGDGGSGGFGSGDGVVFVGGAAADSAGPGGGTGPQAGGGNTAPAIAFTAAAGAVNTLIGTPESDLLVGDPTRPNFIDGRASDDTLVGGNLDDVLIGGGGNDNLSGGAGSDVYIVSIGAGNEDSAFSAGGDVIDDSAGAADRLVVTGLDGDLSQFGGTSRDGDDLLVALGNNTIRLVDHFGAGRIEAITFETASGESRTLTLATGLTGGDTDGIVTGTDGDDTLSAGSGDHALFGGDGDDLLLSGDGDDSYDGGAGFDTLDYGRAVNGLVIDVAAGTAIGGAEIDRDIFTNIERIIGGTGSDTILGGAGDDVIAGGAGNDTLRGGAGADTLDGGTGDDALIGGGGADVLRGDAGDDRLVIGDGSFVLAAGGAGTDTLAVGFDLDLAAVNDNAVSGIERFDLSGGSLLTLGLDDVLAVTDGVNALTGSADTLVVRRGDADTVTVLGDDLAVSAATLDTDNDGVQEGYTVFTDTATGAAVYVENVA